MNYTAQLIRRIEHTPGAWKTCEVGIFTENGRVGVFNRNHPSINGATFVPFEFRGKEYAFIGISYNSIHIYSLPDLKEVARVSDEWNIELIPFAIRRLTTDSWGIEDIDNLFLIGCAVWGGSGSIAVLLDIAQLEEGIIKFQYVRPETPVDEVDVLSENTQLKMMSNDERDTNDPTKTEFYLDLACVVESDRILVDRIETDYDREEREEQYNDQPEEGFKHGSD